MKIVKDDKNIHYTQIRKFKVLKFKISIYENRLWENIQKSSFSIIILLVEYASTPTVYVPRQRHYAAARVTKEKTGEPPKRKWPGSSMGDAAPGGNLSILARKNRQKK